MKNIKLLVVDDDKTDRLFIIRELFKIDKSIVFHEAASAESAMELINQNVFDCILLDYHLPDNNGIETLYQIEEMVPIIMITGDDRETLGLEAVKSGAQDFLLKKSLKGSEIYRSICFSIERNRLLEAKRDQSFRDELTQLYNRRGFLYYAKKKLGLLKLVSRIDCKTQVLFIDIDNFKHINDTFGHKMGDRILIDFAEILTNSFRDVDVLCRIGGDEFAVLLTRNSSESTPDSIFKRLENNIKKGNFAFETPALEFSMSCGLAVHQNTPESTIESLLSQADKAMYINKRMKKQK
jgi:diguanylate cyclase (GGDEF)-like protein